ncbi:hypothetical protein HDZ31DRAFT_63485 [Schizophyllum fasciatum]
MEAPRTISQSRADGELSDESSSEPESAYSDEYSAYSASDEDQTCDNAQLLSRRRPQNRVPLALLCVADEAEIYELMCSALMQRRFLGIDEPLLGFALSPERPYLQLLVAWVEELPSHSCVQVHVTHAAAPSQETGSCEALGIFDMSNLDSGWKLALVLISNRASLTAWNNANWRVDLTRDAEYAETYGLDYDQRVKRWMMDVGRKTGRFSPSVHSIPEGEADYEWANPDIQKRYNKVLKQQLAKTPLTRQARSRKEGPERVKYCQGYERVRELRQAYRTFYRPSRDVMQTLIMPRLCQPKPIPSFSIKEEQMATGYDTQKRRLLYDVKESGKFLQFDERQIQSWYRYHSELALQQAFRDCCGLPSLLPLDATASDDHCTRQLLVAGLRCALHSSDRVSLLLDDSNEMEARQEWDSVISEYFTGTSTAILREDGYRMHSRLERHTPLCRNLMLDATSQTDNSDIIFDHYADFVGVYTDEKAYTRYRLRLPADETVEEFCQGGDGAVLGDMVRQSRTLLTKYSEALTGIITHETVAHQQGGLLFRKHAYGSDALHVRAICDFDYAICDGLVFAEVENVFEDGDISLKDELLEFGVVGNSEGKKRWKEEEEIDVVPRPDAKHPQAVPQIVQFIRNIARKQRSQSSPSHGSLVDPARTPTPAEHVPPVQETAGLASGHEASAYGASATQFDAAGIDMSAHTDKSTPPLLELWRNWKSVCLPILYREYKRGRVHPLQGLNQARIYISSGTHYFSTMNMFNIPVFALATVGKKARLLCGWAEKEEAPGPSTRSKGEAYTIRHRIIDSNCPEWDLSNSSDAIDFASFLALLRTKHVPYVVREFKKQEAAFVADWRDPSKRERFFWTMAHQRRSTVYQEIKQKLDAEDPQVYAQLEQERQAILKENGDAMKVVNAAREKAKEDQEAKIANEKAKADRAMRYERRGQSADAS